VRSLVPGPETALALPPGYRWFATSGRAFAEAWPEDQPPPPPPLSGQPWLRLVGLKAPPDLGPPSAGQVPSLSSPAPSAVPDQGEDPSDATGAADSYSPSPVPPNPRAGGSGDLTLRPASGPRQIPLAIVTALADYFGLPLNRDSVTYQIDAVLQRQSQLNLINIGQVLDSLGLKVILTRLPIDRLGRTPLPAVLEQNGRFGLLDGIDTDGIARILEAEMGPLRLPVSDLATNEDGTLELLLLERKQDAKDRRFNWGWYLPYLREHRRELI
jgi:ATP-binding cassette subfamily B protein